MAMFLLDTNVLSEPLRPHPNPRVMLWLDQHALEAQWVSVVSLIEMRFGVLRLEAGRKQTRLAALVDSLFSKNYMGRCLPIDQETGKRVAGVMAERLSAGKPISRADAEIAGTALQRDLRLVTLNAKDFLGITGLTVVNPDTPDSQN